MNPGYDYNEIEEMEQWDESINSSKYVLVDFFAAWCGPCKALDAQIKKASEKYPNLKIYKVDIDQADEVSDNFEVENLPTVFLYKDGKKKSLFMGNKYELFHKKIDDLMQEE